MARSFERPTFLKSLNAMSLRSSVSTSASSALTMLADIAKWSRRLTPCFASFPRPQAHPDALWRLNKDFAQQLLHARRLWFFELAAQDQPRAHDRACRSKKNRIAVPFQSQPNNSPGAHRVNQQTPEDWGQPQRQVP